ncbi:hypothetical protein F3Y22_tig00111377pilonHSYRG00066 [Hibiscus syriacus]|uniref:Protein kinase domain-containing protein n=1 Tax=Hibiscus syriacus TaxID=106335 RepID=A0A6A2YMY2_HIBSY|nr:hypothetical protein F3Y22_tig00111377pilonHSYRG00066 [Hibiscus syriacus]
MVFHLSLIRTDSIIVLCRTSKKTPPRCCIVFNSSSPIVNDGDLFVRSFHFGKKIALLAIFISETSLEQCSNQTISSIPCCRLHRLNAQCCFIIILLFLPFAHPVSFNITSFVASANSIVYEGDAHPSLGNIELNNVDYLCRVGRAVYSEPIRVWDSSTGALADFTTQFSFTIKTRNATIYGNGFAFFLAPVVSVEYGDWDPPTEHVGINNSSMKSVVYAPWIAGSNTGKVANVWITYNATAQNLSVFWTYDEHPVFMGNSSLSCVIDLKKNLPQWVKIGFSAGTVQYTEYNTIKSWKFTSNLETNPSWFFLWRPKKGIPCWSRPNRMPSGNRDVDGDGHTNGANEVSPHIDGGGIPNFFSYNNYLKLPMSSGKTKDWAEERRHMHKIAIELAFALNYLHEGAEQCVIHREIKSDIVLLDLDFTTKLADFGVSKLIEGGQKTQTTKIIGTYGYLAPEYLQEGKARRRTCTALGLWCWRFAVGGNRIERARWLGWCGSYTLPAASSSLPMHGEALKVLLKESPLPELPQDMFPPPLATLEINTSGSELTEGSR